MARRGGRGTDRGTGGRGAQDASESGVWALGDYEWDDDGDRAAPPWEQEDWEDSPSSRPRDGLSGGLNVGVWEPGLAPGHPSGPLPSVRGRRGRPGGDEDYQTGEFPAGHPSGPLPSARGRRGRSGGDEDYPTGGFPAGDYPTGGLSARDYPTGGFPAADHSAGPHGRGARGASARRAPSADAFAEPYAADPYGEEGYDEEAYEDDAYSEDGGYADEYGYEAEENDWYEDDEQDWADDEDDEDDDEAFLPGVSSVRASRAGEQGRAGRRGSGAGAARGKGKGKAARGGRKRRTGLWVTLSVLLVLLAGGGTGAYLFAWPKLFPPDYTGPGSGSVIVHIGAGDNATTIGQILQQDGVVASSRAFHNAADANPKSIGLQPGVYQLHEHMQASLALNMLLNPASLVVYKVTIPEGLRLSAVIARLGQATHDLAGYQAAIKDVSALGLPSYAKGNPEGFLFPDTYQIQPSTPPIKVLQEMVAEFKKQASGLQLPKWAAHDQMSQREIVILASLIQAEGNGVDFGKISRTIYNRLNQWNPPLLQLDSTVMYALDTYGIASTQAQLTAAKKSPYDTYAHPGLPPGPIDSPGQAALQAALRPASGNWLYFITVDPKTRKTLFTSSSTQFNAWVAKYQAAINKG